MMERGWKPNSEISPNCPRCGSSNTKFCYYNNYSLTQPRYFCKGCRRYWTKGGSLRNVPVGGGCRKNRRGNKTFTQSSTHALPSKVPYGPIAHSYDPTKSAYASSSSSDAPNIDLALVYANFLNQKPDSRAGLENMPDQTQTVFDPSLEYSSLYNALVGPSVTFPEELGLTAGCLNLSEQSHFSEGNEKYFGGFNSMQEDRIEQCSSHDTINFDLPPLPGEEAASHDMMWSDSEMMVNHALQAPQPPVLGPQPHDADLLMGNWGPFDSLRDASFPRP